MDAHATRLPLTLARGRAPRPGRSSALADRAENRPIRKTVVTLQVERAA